MRPRTPSKWKKGDRITANRLNEMLDLILRLDITVPMGNPLRVQQSASGTLLSIDMTGYGFLAVCSATVAPGSGMSGGSPGATGTCSIGTFYPVTLTPPASFVAGGTISLSVETNTSPVLAYNPSKTKMSSTNGIDSGQLCWLQMDNTGMYMATPLECA